MQGVFEPTQQPIIRDDQGHLTQRTSFYIGQQNSNEFVDMNVRIAYHELMDLPDGFIKGGQIEMGSLVLRAINDTQGSGSDHSKLQLQAFNIINILSLGARDYFQQPVSWRVKLGFDRFILEGSDLFAHLDVAGGYSYEAIWQNYKLGQVYGLLEARLKTSGQFQYDYQLSAGTQLGWLYQGSDWQINTYASYFPSVAGAEFDYQDVSLAFGRKLDTNLQLRLEAVKQVVQDGSDSDDGDSVKLGINWYF